MFLLQIINNKISLIHILRYKDYIKNLKNKIFLLKKLKEQTNYKDLRFVLNKNFGIKQSLIMYIINIILTNKNTVIYVTDIKGNLKFFQSANSLNIIGKQKTTQPVALLRVLKQFLSNTEFLKNKPIALHFNNVKKSFIVFLIKILENILFIKVIRIYDFLIPHNGCRPKKKKRKK